VQQILGFISAGAEILLRKVVISMTIFHEILMIMQSVASLVLAVYMTIKTRLEIKILRTKTADSAKSTANTDDTE
jgi:hypothetical protein